MISKPNFTRTRLGYLLAWPGEGLQVEVRRLSEGEHLSGECLFYADGPQGRGLLHITRLSFTSSQSKQTCVRALNERMPNVDWAGALEQMTLYVVNAYRNGGEAIHLGSAPAADKRWLLYPYLEHEQITIWYAYGGTGKSILALAALVSLASGKMFVGTPQQVGPVLYLDWETSAEVHRERLHALCAPLALDPATLPIFYRRMSASLAQSVESIIADVEQHHIVALVVDSLGLAGGDDPEKAATIIATATALRQIGVAALCLHHRRKNGARPSGDLDSLFGSVYYTNMARHVWELDAAHQGEDGSDTIQVAMLHMKSNNTTHPPRHGYEISFLNDLNDVCRAIPISYIKNLGASPELAEHATLTERALAALQRGARTVNDLADQIGCKPDVVRATMQRLVNRKEVVRLQPGVYGLAHHTE